MSVEFLKIIRKTERDCEEKIKQTEASKQNAILEAEKTSVLKVRDAEIQAKEEDEKILSCSEDIFEKEIASMNKKFEVNKNKFNEKAKQVEKIAIDVVLSEVL